MTVRIFRAWTWTISLVAVEVICATGYAALMSRLVAGWDCLAALRHAGKLRHYEVAVRNVEIEAFTRRHQCELGLSRRSGTAWSTASPTGSMSGVHRLNSL